MSHLALALFQRRRRLTSRQVHPLKTCSGRGWFLILLLVATTALGAQPLIGYDLEASLHPDEGTLAVTATLTLPEDREDWTFLLYPGLQPRVFAGAARLEPRPYQRRGGSPGRRQRLVPTLRGRPLSLSPPSGPAPRLERRLPGRRTRPHHRDRLLPAWRQSG